MTRHARPLIALVLGLAATVLAQETAGRKVVVVVNAANHETSIKRSLLSDIFLKKTTRWPQGATAAPLDQSATSPVRAAFTREVHARDVNAVQNYWQQQIFSGRATPPPVKLSDAEVLAFVQAKPEAVGYVSSAVALPEGVKALKVTE